MNLKSHFALACLSLPILALNAQEKFTSFSDDFNNPETYKANWTVYAPNSPGRVERLTDEAGNSFIAVTSPERTAKGVTHALTGLDPNRLYRVSARVKTDFVAEGRGAVLYIAPRDHVNQPWNASKFVYGANDWQDVYMDFVSDSDGKAEIVLALGFPWGTYNGGTALGTAMWDDVTVTECPANAMTSAHGKHVSVYFDSDKMEIPVAELEPWVKQLDKVYECYSKLVGGVPYDGQRLNIIATPGIEAGYWALAGNPILVNNRQKLSDMPATFNSDGDWSFGVTHEIGHVFNAGAMHKNARWNWNDELFANFRMNYALDKLNGVVSQRDKYKGRDIMNYYKKAYDSTIGQGKPSCTGDALHYTLLRVKEKYGWKVFEKAFRKLYDMDENQINWNTPGYDKFIFFLNTLSDCAGHDVIAATYTPQELELIKQGFETK